jgi:hypothetical protein
MERKLVTTLVAECITDDNNPDSLPHHLHELDLEAGSKLIKFLEAHQHSEFIVRVAVRKQQINTDEVKTECPYLIPGFTSTKYRKTVYLYQDVEEECAKYIPGEERIDVHK